MERSLDLSQPAARDALSEGLVLTLKRLRDQVQTLRSCVHSDGMVATKVCAILASVVELLNDGVKCAEELDCDGAQAGGSASLPASRKHTPRRPAEA